MNYARQLVSIILTIWLSIIIRVSPITSVTVWISGITKGGAIASLEGIRAFIPASKLSLGYVEENDLNDWLGKSIEARVITAQEEGSKLVLSAKEILREKEAEERRTRISNVQPGLVTEGTVETIKDYGAFINLGKGLSGLLHVSQIVNRRIKTPSEVLKEGDKVKVKVIAVKDGKLSLSMKALEEDAPAEEVVEVTFKLPESKEIGTSLGSLLKGLKLRIREPSVFSEFTASVLSDHFKRTRNITSRVLLNVFSFLLSGVQVFSPVFRKPVRSSVFSPVFS